MLFRAPEPEPERLSQALWLWLRSLRRPAVSLGVGACECLCVCLCGRNINNLKYVDDTTLTAESEEELRSLLMMVKEESERASLKLNIKNIRS